MKREREELRRGIRSVIKDAGVELAEFTGTATAMPRVVPPPAPPVDVRPLAPAKPEPPSRPILKLVREAPPAEAPPRPTLSEMTLHLPKKGVCAAYFQNKRCWELPDAYCNHALHICRLRECPVYDLHREEMERRFAAKFSHLW